MKRLKLNLDLEKLIIDDYLAGLTAKECQDKHNVSIYSVNKLLREKKLMRSHSEATKHFYDALPVSYDKNQILSLYESGLSYKEIARELSIGWAIIRRIVLEAGKARTKGQGTKVYRVRHPELDKEIGLKNRSKVEIGKIFGNFLVVSVVPNTVRTWIIAKCILCGEESERPYSIITHELNESCGCSQKQKWATSKIGKRFGRLIVRYSVGVKNRENYWFCDCDCGGIAVVKNGPLVQGHTMSCGCLRTLVATKHGQGAPGRKTLAYVSYQSMLNRCFNPNTPNFERYGGRGITICERWLGSDGFIHFFEDMGPRPKGKTLDRIDNDLLIDSYSKGNCHWATYKEQSHNTSVSAKTVDYDEHLRWRRYLGQLLHDCLRNNFESPIFKQYYGTSVANFKIHIASQFKIGMNWANNGLLGSLENVWQFDHITPVNQFDLSQEKERISCYHWSNFQPLWIPDHVEKRKKDNKLYAIV